jgi:hypothetical protein
MNVARQKIRPCVVRITTLRQRGASAARFPQPRRELHALTELLDLNRLFDVRKLRTRRPHQLKGMLSSMWVKAPVPTILSFAYPAEISISTFPNFRLDRWPPTRHCWKRSSPSRLAVGPT